MVERRELGRSGWQLLVARPPNQGNARVLPVGEGILPHELVPGFRHCESRELRMKFANAECIRQVAAATAPVK